MINTIGTVLNEIGNNGFVLIRNEEGRYYFTKDNASLEYTTPCKDTADYHRIRCHVGTDIKEWHDQMYICYYFDEMFDSMFWRIEYVCELSLDDY